MTFHLIFLPLRRLLPSPAPPYSPKIDNETPALRKSPPTLGARHRDAEPKKPPAQHRQSCAPAQNTCHDRKWCTKHLSYLPVIEPQRQNPCCRTLALTCADAGCPSTPGSHDFGPPRQQAGTMNPPKNPTPNDPLLCPSGANTDRPTRARCPPCSPNPTPPHIHYVPHHKTPPRFQNPRLTDLSTSQSAPPDPPETITIVCSPEPPERKTAHHMVALPPRPESHM